MKVTVVGAGNVGATCANVIAHNDQDFGVLVLRRNRSDFAAPVSIPSSL